MGLLVARLSTFIVLSIEKTLQHQQNEARSDYIKSPGECDKKRLSYNRSTRFAKRTQRRETSAKSSSTKNDR
ncbi:hypothetical protein FOQG_12471 [Fusarium oxysporum f. sp. raphani 54005]|jgi:hypothetical protein|uniref:Uncharacterized protein n=1 Tax=Fusarium oxysporum f. sp. raphani 54005 TaxID=1089458 RepID=X0BN84_FUSOX|nr:hypothetical protein FOQG_12471 [Fusarium oxysporum f. sp. raphani 54005]